MTDKVDVVIIGGGIAGLCTGLYLQKMGKRSIILEHGNQVGGNMAGIWRKGFYFDCGDQSTEEVGILFPVLKELGEIVIRAIRKMNPRQRAILSLRCFENMPYSQIAESVGCHETTVRVHFHRARKKLRSNLKAQGISGSMVLLAMVVFGKCTASEAMAGNITTASVAMGYLNYIAAGSASHATASFAMGQQNQIGDGSAAEAKQRGDSAKAHDQKFSGHLDSPAIV